MFQVFWMFPPNSVANGAQSELVNDTDWLHIHLCVSACLLSVTDSQVTELTSGSLTDIEGHMCQYVCVPDYYSHFIDLFIYLYMGEREREREKMQRNLSEYTGKKELKA